MLGDPDFGFPSEGFSSPLATKPSDLKLHKQNSYVIDECARTRGLARSSLKAPVMQTALSIFCKLTYRSANASFHMLLNTSVENHSGWRHSKEPRADITYLPPVRLICAVSPFTSMFVPKGREASAKR